MKFDKVFDDMKGQIETLAKKDLKGLAGQGQQDAGAFLEQSQTKLKKWMQLLAKKKIDKDEFRWLVESQKAAAEMESLRAASASRVRIEKFRDSVFSIVVKTALAAAVAAI
jgi:hypothetical protein